MAIFPGEPRLSGFIEAKENECEALPGVAYPGVRDNRSTLNTKTGYDEWNEWWIRMMEVVVTTGAIRCSKLCSDQYHQQTNTQCFTVRMTFLSPNQ